MRKSCSLQDRLQPYDHMTSPISVSNSQGFGGALPAGLRLGSVHLTVTDLGRSTAFYQNALGLQVHRRADAASAALGAGLEDLVVLTEERDAEQAGGHAGLYHLALLHPSRLELARAARRLVISRAAIDGASDHGVSEALYLSDPDGNGIELYADRPRGRWPAASGGGRVTTFTQPLDFRGLLGLVSAEGLHRHADPGLVLGHMHLHVGDIADGLAFYVDVLGFELMATLPSAAFVASGGYHHHLGFNTWRGEGVGAAPAGSVGLRHWEIVLPDEASLAGVHARINSAGIASEERDMALLVRDQWANAVVLRAAAAEAARAAA